RRGAARPAESRGTERGANQRADDHGDDRTNARGGVMKLRLLWPIIVLTLILLFNYFFTPRFFHVDVRNGRLYGSLITIVHRGSPVLLLALGMTPVIATGGIDLSVGAVMAIAGAVAAILIARPEYSWLSRIDVHDSTALVILFALG